MNDKNEITKEAVEADMEFNINKPSNDLQVIPDSQQIAVAESPAMMMLRAKEAGLDADQMKQMLDVQKEWEANEALKAFNLAVAQFRENPPTVYKDKKNKQYGDSGYVSLGNMVNTASAELSKYGLSARWSFNTMENNLIVCTCILSHRLGHSESVTVDGPPDESGKKNALQARKSTRTYLKLESFEAVTGMASVEANLDDDGAASEPVAEIERITQEQVLTILSKITDNEMSTEIFMGWLTKVFPYCQKIDDLAAEHYQKVIDKIDASIKHKQEAVE